MKAVYQTVAVVNGHLANGDGLTPEDREIAKQMGMTEGDMVVAKVAEFNARNQHLANGDRFFRRQTAQNRDQGYSGMRNRHGSIRYQVSGIRYQEKSALEKHQEKNCRAAAQ